MIECYDNIPELISFAFLSALSFIAMLNYSLGSNNIKS